MTKQQRVKWTLTEIKNGVMVKEYNLTKLLKRKDDLTILIGRQEDIVDIVQYHDSISRRHAILSFSNDSLDTVTIYDLNSNHGVYINYEKMMPPAPSTQKIDATEIKEQQLTGGIQIHSGDIIQLGASTRYFVLEQQSSEMQEGNNFNIINEAAPEHNDQTVTSTSSQIDIDVENDVYTSTCTYASKASLDSKSIQIQYRDKAHDKNNQAYYNKQQLSIDQIPEKYQKESGHITTLKSKVESRQIENDRIKSKENTGLYDTNGSGLKTGQQHRLHRNDEKIQQLTQQIEQREEVLHDKIFRSTNNSQTVRTKKRNRNSVYNEINDVDFGNNNDIEDGESTFYDQTKNGSDHVATNVVEKETTSLQKRNNLTQSRKLMQSTIDMTEQNASIVLVTQKHDRPNTSTSIDSCSCNVATNKLLSPPSNIVKESQHQEKSSSTMMVDEKKNVIFPRLAPHSKSKKLNSSVQQCNPFILATRTLQTIDVEKNFWLPNTVLKITSRHLRPNVENGLIINTTQQNSTTTSSHKDPSQTKALSANVQKYDDTTTPNTSTTIDSTSCTVATNELMSLPSSIVKESQHQQESSSTVMVDDKKNVNLQQLAPQSISKKSKRSVQQCNPFILATSTLETLEVEKDFWLPNTVLNITSPHLGLNVEHGIVINTKERNRTTTSSHNEPSQTRTLSAIFEKHDDTVKMKTSTNIDSTSCTVAKNKLKAPLTNIVKPSQHQQKSSSMVMVDDKKNVMFPQLAPQSISKKSNGAVLLCNPFILAMSTLQTIDVEEDFWLPNSLMKMQNISRPNAKPISRTRIRRTKKIKQGGSSSRRKKPSDDKYCPPLYTNKTLEEPDDYTIFKDTCARIDNPYMSSPLQSKTPSTLYPSLGHEVIRNLREHIRKSTTNKQINHVVDTDQIGSSRAARANQRRLLKDFSSFGGSAAHNLGSLDALSNREPQLRFNRSSIHAWGVFADEDITADKMIIEYRGELIENAMAEKREKVYEAKKIGSDYMFRIDADLICDATKQGNVARFINASCDPNCYTKIISLDGTKRIVIYAKRDICTGEELCYDYKFPIEYDKTKRIPCHCGARDCRGFMNWDKKLQAKQKASSVQDKMS